MLNSRKRKKNTDFFSFITYLTAENAPNVGALNTYDVTDELRRLNLSKCFTP